MKEYSNSSGGLPTDILIEIFSLLPVKTLVQLCCICKSWKSLIFSDHTFIRSHLKRSLEKNTRTKSNVLMYSPTIGSSLTGEAPRFMNAGENCLDRAFFLGHNVHFLGCINGVFCFYKFSGYDVYLWNPALHQCWILPRSRLRYFTVLAFVFEPTNIDYKVVKIWARSDKLEVEIYNLSSNSWKSSICDNGRFSEVRNPYQKLAIAHNEALHWLSWRYEALVMNVYDLGRENFEQTLLPDLVTIGHNSGLGFFQQWICLTGRSKMLDNFEVWVMKEYGEHNSWTKLFIFPSDMFLYSIFPACAYETTITRGKFVAIWGTWPDEYIILYDPENGDIELVQNEEVLYEFSSNYFFVDNYVESLISVIPRNRTTSNESSALVIPQGEASPKQNSVSIVPQDGRTQESSVSYNTPVNETTPEETLVSVIPTNKTTLEESLDSVLLLNETPDPDLVCTWNFSFLRRLFCCLFLQELR